MTKRIVFTNSAGGVSVIIPTGEIPIEEVAAKDVPSGVPFQIVNASDVPADRMFRNAWEVAGKKVAPNLEGARSITHDRRRANRDREMAPFDEIIGKAIPAPGADLAEAARARIRSKHDAMQVSIDACGTADALKALIEAEKI